MTPSRPRGPGRSAAARLVALLVASVTLTACATAVSRGDAALHAGHPAEAARHFGEALAADPARVDARVGLGIARFRLGDWTAAVGALDDVAAAQPRRADAHLYLALARLMLGDVPAARAHLVSLRALPLHPRIAAQIDRVLPVLVPGVDRTVRDLVAAGLDDAYQWATDVAEARRQARGLLEPSWTISWGHSYPPALYGPYRGALPSAP